MEKYSPRTMSLLGFFVVLGICVLLGEVFNTDWLAIRFFRETPQGRVFQLGIPWATVGLSLLASFLCWNYAIEKNSKDDESKGQD